MNGKQQAMDGVKEFLMSSQKGILITGTHQFEKHLLAIAMIDQYYRNAHVLFRINVMNNITESSFLGCVGVKRQPHVGERIRIGHNFYEFDTLLNRGSWYKSSNKFDFAIVYPIDGIVSRGNTEPIDNIVQYKNVDKIFLCSWTDIRLSDYALLQPYYDTHVIYDAEDEDPEYHNRVLGFRA